MESGSSSLSLKEVVEGEVAIIQSAFANEFEDLRDKDVWKVPRPPEVRLKLGPHYTQGGTLHSHVSVTIRIATSYRYPNEAADVTLESYSGITDQESALLHNELQELSTNSAQSGLVVMLDICQHAQNFLSEHAKPYSESIYAEMVAGWKAREAAIQEAEEENIKQKEKQEEEQRIHLQGEVERVQEALKQEAKLRKERLKPGHGRAVDGRERISLTDSTKSMHKRWCDRTMSECSNESSSSEVFTFASLTYITNGKQEHQIILQDVLGERPEQGCLVELGQDKTTLERCVVYTWCTSNRRQGRKERQRLTSLSQYQIDELYSKLNSLEKEMNSLLKLSCENLVAFKGMKIAKPQSDCVQIHIIQEYVQGLSLRYYLDRKIPLNEALIYHVASGLVKGLDYLHQNNVVHRNIRDSCVFLDHQTQRVKLADFGVERRCVEAVMELYDEDPLSLYPSSPGRGGKKCDVFRVGILLLSLIKGERIMEVAPSVPPELCSDLQGFLQCCLELIEQDRWTTMQLLLHPFLTLSERERKKSSDDKISFIPVNHEDLEHSAPLMNEADDSSLNVPLHLPPNLKGYSRFSLEYNLLEWLGKGGFGHVYKVRNKVDDRVYALKRIPLHHQTENTRRKMTREVKLLSSLNHENVVRYYTSWIESFTVDQQEDREEDTVDGKTTDSRSFDDLSTADEPKVIESDSGEEEGDWLLHSLRCMYEDKDDSDGVVFLNSDGSSPEQVMDDDEKSCTKNSVAQASKRLQFLYIQMQYCEKNTLRQAIDKSLYLNEDRVWRLFIEMTNGLDYIHSQGLIHRDLKPGNVFLDSTDHVKIGDFGLATVTFKGMSTASGAINLDAEVYDTKEPEPSALTGHVGTTFYIAPEISKVTGKVSYTNKVDIYSLGIIFFEMTYPLATGMERVKTLSMLRLPEIQFPQDYSEKDSSSKAELICWLLQHDPQHRPSTGELLKSSLVPPPTEEKQKFMATLEAKIQNERSQDYQDILNFLFKSSARPELEATFEVDMHKFGPKQLWLYNWVRTYINFIFRSHGAVWIPMPFYIPKGSFYQEKENLVSLMSRGGELVAAQFELRYPFARFIARNDLKRLRRYAVDRVQRAHRISGIHPTEIYECAFDIVGPKQDFAESCARVLLVAQEILIKVAGLQVSQIVLRITHSELVKIMLTYCGVEEALQASTINLLKDFRGNSYHLEYFGESLRSLGVSKNALETLKGFMLTEGSVEEIGSLLQTRILASSKRKSFHSSLKGVLAQLRETIETSVTMGVQFDICVHPLMVVDENLYSGIAFRLVPPQTSSKKSIFSIFAQGGVYDHLITQLRNKILPVSKRSEGLISAIGISLPLERIVGAINTNSIFSSSPIDIKNRFHGHINSESPLLEIFICAVEQRQLKERVHLASKLRAENIVVDHGYALNMAEAENLFDEYWFTPRVFHFLFLGPSDKVICRCCDGLNHSSARADKKIPRTDLLEFLLKLIRGSRTSEAQSSSCSSAAIKREISKPGTSIKPEDYMIHIEYVTRKQARIKDVAKNKIDSQITVDVTSCLSCRGPFISSGDAVEVLALDLDRKALLALGQLDVDSNARNFNESVNEVKSRFPEMKDYIDRICTILAKKIFYGKKSDRPAVIICYSIPSETLKRIL